MCTLRFTEAEETLRKCIRLGASAVTVNSVCSEEEEKQIRIDIKEQLEQLKAIATDKGCGNSERIKNLMSHLYTVLPPKNAEHKMGDTSDSALKKTLLKAIMHYHRSVSGMYDVILRTLTEQVAELYKGV